MILLKETASVAVREDIGAEFQHAGRKVKECDLQWKPCSGWPGREYALLTIGPAYDKDGKLLYKGRPQRLMFERDTPKES